MTFWLGLDERWALDRQRRQEDCLVERGKGGKGKTEEEIPKRGNRICKELEVLCVGVRECIPQKNYMQKNPQNPDCFLQLPTFQNILKLHRETQDFFSTELSSVPLTLLGAKTKSCSFKVHRCSGDWKYKWDSSERHVVTLRERVWLKKSQREKPKIKRMEARLSALKLSLRERDHLNW